MIGRVRQLLEFLTLSGRRGRKRAADGVVAAGARDDAEAIRSLCYPDLIYPNGTYRDSFPAYVRMVNLAYHVGSRNVLELGAGLSTGLWVRFAKQTGAAVTSVCDDFTPMRSYLRNTRELALAEDFVRCVEGLTLSADAMAGFYSGDPLATFGDVPASAIREHLGAFVGPWDSAGGGRKRLLVESFGGEASVLDVVFQGRRMRFPRLLLDCYSADMSFDSELALCRRAQTRGKVGVLDGLLGENAEYDFVFFDSGELSTMIEWLKLKDRIAVGGLAAFHDIYFPKSFKSFIVCASIQADANWRVVYLDNSTDQGLMVAQRLK